jgi:hypothetical protein
MPPQTPKSIGPEQIDTLVMSISWGGRIYKVAGVKPTLQQQMGERMIAGLQILIK